MPVTDMLGLVGDDLDTYPTIGEAYDGNGAGFMDDRLRFLVIREMMGNRYMTVAIGIDTRHLSAE